MSEDEPPITRKWRELFEELPAARRRSLGESLDHGAKNEAELSQLAKLLVPAVDLLRDGGEQLGLFPEAENEGAGGQLIIFPSGRRLKQRSNEAAESHRDFVAIRTAELIAKAEKKLGPLRHAERRLLEQRYESLHSRLQAARANDVEIFEQLIRELGEGRGA